MTHSPTTWSTISTLQRGLPAVLLFLLTTLGTIAQDVGFYGVLKGQNFQQTNAGPAVGVGGASNAFFRTFVDGQGQGALTSAVVVLPTLATRVLMPEGGGGGGGASGQSEFKFEESFATLAELNGAYTNGSYTLLFGTVNDGNRTNQLALTGDDYPATPFFTNFVAAQAVDPALDFTLHWELIPALGPNDFVEIQLTDCRGQDVFRTGGPGEPGAIDPAATSLLIPARTLRPGQKYEVVMLVARFVTVDETGYPGATGIAGYLKYTRFHLVTTGTPVGCPPGRLELSFGYPPFNFGGSTQGVVNFPQGLDRYLVNFNIEDQAIPPNFPSTVTFTGPAGSGLNATTSSQMGTFQNSAYYASPFVPMPGFPPGGVYTVNYSGGDLLFNLLDPDAASQQILLVPTVIVSAQGELTEVQWVYKTPDGTTVGTPPFLRSIEVRVQGTNSPLYGTEQGNEPVSPSTNSHTLTELVFWDEVAQIQMQFRDSAGNSFFSVWDRFLPPLQIISPPLPDGVVGGFYSNRLQAVGGQPPYNWTISAGALPPELQLNVGTGAITGTPTNAGDFTFTVMVDDAGQGSVQRAFNLHILSQPGLTIDPLQLPNGFLGVAYSNQLVAVSGQAPLNWGLKLGAFPPGLSLDRNQGIFQGVPTNAGVFSFTVGVVDAAMTAGERAYTVEIFAGAPLGFAPDPLPGGSVSNVYSGFLTAVGGTPPYDFFVDQAVLPPGLSLDTSLGEFFGVPEVAGTFDFSVTVTDANSDTAEQSFQIQIRPPGPDATSYVVAKGWHFFQVDTNGPQFDNFQFVTFVESSGADHVSSATLQLPGGGVRQLTNDFDRFMLEEMFMTQPELDLAFANGAYTFSILATNDGPQSSTLVLTNDVYPVAPRLTDWSAAQQINPAADFTLTWDAFTGASTLDFIVFRVEDGNGQEIFSSPGFLEPNYFTGTQTSIVIPADALDPASAYEARLMFIKQTAYDTNQYQGVPGIAAYFAETKFPLTTINPAGVLEFSSANYQTNEGAGSLVITLVRRGGSAGPVSATVTTANLTATAGADYTGGNAVVTFADGVISATFAVAITDDSASESNETFGLFFSNITGGAGAGALTNALVTLTDNDFLANAGALQFSAAAYPAGESSGSVLITVTRSGGSSGTVSVDYATTTGSASAEEDYEETTGTLEFGTGVTSRTFTIPITSDAFDETNETVQLVLDNPTGGASLGGRASALLTINDDDSGGVISFSVASASVSEAGLEAAIEIKRTGGQAAGVTVDFATTGGSATEGDDFEAAGGTLEFEEGEVLKTINITLINDTEPETNETLTVAISLPTGGARLGAQTNTTLRLLDDEVVLQFSRTLVTNSEAVTAVVLSVVRSGPSTEEVTVDFATSDGSALDGEDYTATEGTLTFPAGVNARSITIPTLPDTASETNEDFTVTLSNPGNEAQLGERSEATVIIKDNDEGGVIGFSQVSYSVRENVPVALITVVRSEGKASDVSVDFTASAESATEDEDYTATSGTLTFGAGVKKLTFEVPLLDDTVEEGNETILLALSNPSGGATLGARDEATLTIKENDEAGALCLSHAKYSVSETSSVAVITFLRVGGKASGATAEFSTSDGTALDGSDYTATTGTVTFEANETKKTVTVPILGDTSPEGNETVLLRLRNPGPGVKLVNFTNAVLTIVDDEASVQFASATQNVSEGKKSVTLTVVRSGPLGTAFSVGYTTSDGTATAGADYTGKTGTLNFGANATSKTITIALRSDTAVEGDETFTIQLGTPTGGVQLGLRDEIEVTIQDND